jgi:hypothetical protein
VPFASAEQQAIDTVEARLAAAEADLQAAEASAPAAALRVHTGNPEDGDADLLARLPILRAECASLYMARDAATQAEADRKEQARLRELAATCRAATQHLARLERELGAAAVHLSNAQSAYARACEAGRSALASMPGRLRADHELQLTDKYLQRLLLVEGRQCGVRAGATAFMVPEFYGYAEHLKSWQSGKVPTIAVLLARILEPMRAKLRQFIPSPAADSQSTAADDAAASEIIAGSGAAATPLDLEEQAA